MWRLFSRYVRLKRFFSDQKKHQRLNLRQHFSREAIENQRGKVLKGYSIIGRSWISAKLFMIQNYTDDTNGDLPLIVESVWYFSCAHALLRRKTKLTIVFFIKYDFTRDHMQNCDKSKYLSNNGSVKNNFKTKLKESYNIVERRVKLKECRSIVKSSLLFLIILD